MANNELSLLSGFNNKSEFRHHTPPCDFFTACSIGAGDRVDQILRSNPREIEFVSVDGWTPLMIAANQGHYRVVTKLIAAGSDVNARNFMGRTALMLAASNGHLRCAENLTLLGNADTSIKDNNGETAYDIAKRHGHGSSKTLLNVIKPKINEGASPRVVAPRPPRIINARPTPRKQDEASAVAVEEKPNSVPSVKLQYPSPQQEMTAFQEMDLIQQAAHRLCSSSNTLNQPPSTPTWSNGGDSYCHFLSPQLQRPSYQPPNNTPSILELLGSPSKTYTPHPNTPVTPLMSSNVSPMMSPNVSPLGTPNYNNGNTMQQNTPFGNQLYSFADIQNQGTATSPSGTYNIGPVEVPRVTEQNQRQVPELSLANDQPPLPASIEDLLIRMGLPQYMELFKQEEINLYVFLTLTEKDLQKVGVKSFGNRQRLMTAQRRFHESIQITNLQEGCVNDWLLGERERLYDENMKLRKQIDELESIDLNNNAK